MPGFGSLMAGRTSGYFQAGLAFAGLILTVVFGLRFVAWYIRHWSAITSSDGDFSVLKDMWLVLRWSLLGLAIFLIGWLWALGSSLRILWSADRDPPAADPPRLK
jgi:hypothetical protein